MLAHAGRDSEIPMLRKCRGAFGAIYAKAGACVRVVDSSKVKVHSGRFPICRGVLQGDIFSPAAFIFALAVVMLRHGGRASGEDSTLGAILRVIAGLLYANDAALVDEGVQQAEERVNKLAGGAWRDADVGISLPKTECTHVKVQDPVSPVTAADYRNLTECKDPVLKFKCGSCGMGFDTHQGRE